MKDDPYEEAAQALFDTEVVTPAQRRLAKSVVYSTIYGAPVDSQSAIRTLIDRRRRARRQQRWAIALILIGSALLLAWGAFNAH